MQTRPRPSTLHLHLTSKQSLQHHHQDPIQQIQTYMATRSTVVHLRNIGAPGPSKGRAILVDSHNIPHTWVR